MSKPTDAQQDETIERLKLRHLSKDTLVLMVADLAWAAEQTAALSVSQAPEQPPFDLEPFKALARTHRMPKDAFAESLSEAIFALCRHIEQPTGVPQAPPQAPK